MWMYTIYIRTGGITALCYGLLTYGHSSVSYTRAIYFIVAVYICVLGVAKHGISRREIYIGLFIRHCPFRN